VARAGAVSADWAGGACDTAGNAAAPAGGAACPADRLIVRGAGPPRGGISDQAPPTDLVVLVHLDREGGWAGLSLSEAACGWSLSRINDFLSTLHGGVRGDFPGGSSQIPQPPFTKGGFAQ
jgi:hypothetical protein